MAKIVDLDILVPEGLEFKIGGDIYTISGNPSTELTIQFMGFQDKSSKAKKAENQVELLAEMTSLILNQDKTHDVDKDFVMKNLSLQQMKVITDEFMKLIQGLESSPNS